MVQHDKEAMNYVEKEEDEEGKKKQTVCLSDFFLFLFFFNCQFESAIQMWCYLEKINCICLVVNQSGNKPISLLTRKLLHPGIK